MTCVTLRYLTIILVAISPNSQRHGAARKVLTNTRLTIVDLVKLVIRTCINSPTDYNIIANPYNDIPRTHNRQTPPSHLIILLNIMHWSGY